MKKQLFTLIAGATVAAMPFMMQLSAQAAPLQNNRPGMRPVLQMADRGTGDRGGQGLEKLAQELNLTDTQKQQLKALRESRRSQIDAILTDTQRQQIKTAIQNKQGMREAMKAANLTDSQKQQIKTLMQGSRSDLESILTDAQKQILRSKMQEHKNNRAQHSKG